MDKMSLSHEYVSSFISATPAKRRKLPKYIFFSFEISLKNVQDVSNFLFLVFIAMRVCNMTYFAVTVLL